MIFRHELKYLIDERLHVEYRQRIQTVTELDTNAGEGGRYTIRSLYFEDIWNTAYADKLSGVDARKKYRIRIYNYSDSSIKLECKHKQVSYIHKESVDLSRDEYEQITAGDYVFLLQRPEDLCQEFYLECMQRLLRPRVIVDYEREPYTIDTGDVRVTFDLDVRSALLSYDIFDPDLPTIRALEPGKQVMEVKFTGFLPTAVKKLLADASSEYSAISKYVLCYDAARCRVADYE